jgi:electron transport complex protein RnfD
MLKIRHRPIKPFLMDGSAIVTAVLLAIALPPLAPWWLTTVGVLFAIIFATLLLICFSSVIIY